MCQFLAALATKTADAATRKISINTRGDAIVPVVNMIFELLRSIEGAAPKYGRAPRTALGREISHRLGKLPSVSVKGKGHGNGASSSGDS